MQQFVFGVILILFSCIGHSELWVMLVNRMYGRRFRHNRLRMLRHVHDVAVLLYPLVLFIGAGVCEDGLLRGGRLSDLAAFWRFWIPFTLVGMIPFTAGVIRWHLFQKQSFLRKDSSERFDVQAIGRQRPELGDIRGPRRHFAKSVPFSETFTLELSQKSITVPSAAGRSAGGRTAAGAAIDSQSDGSQTSSLRILHISDLHFVGCPGEGFYKFMIELALQQKPDLCVFAGDLIDDPELIPFAVRTLRPLTEHMPCYFVLGNHDWRYDHEAIRRAVIEGGWTALGQSPVSTTINGWDLHLEGSELPWMGDRFDHPDPAADLPFPSATDRPLRILVSHSPDQFTFAVNKKFDLMLTGHTHGGQIVLPIIGPVYSPSIHGVRYASGIFEFGDMTLHVSRGVGGKDPLRWRCPPEITILNVTRRDSH